MNCAKCNSSFLKKSSNRSKKKLNVLLRCVVRLSEEFGVMNVCHVADLN